MVMIAVKLLKMNNIIGKKNRGRFALVIAADTGLRLRPAGV